MKIDYHGQEKDVRLDTMHKYLEADKIKLFFKDKTFCITGALQVYNREHYIWLIEKYKGRVSSSVTKKTDFLITNETTMTTKRKKANAYGTKIVTEGRIIDLIVLNAKLKLWKGLNKWNGMI